jgi:hypothetical protein
MRDSSAVVARPLQDGLEDEPTPESSRRWPGRLLPLIVSLAGFLAVSLLPFIPIWRSPFATVAGSDATDAGIFIWGLKWVPFALSHGQNPFFSNYLDWPAGANLMWNTVMPVAGVLLWPVTAVFGPVVSYNALVTLAFGLSGWTAFLAIRRYVSSWVAAALGGLLYGFSPYMVAQSQGHPHMVLAFFPPIVLLLLDEIVVRQARRAVWMGAVLGAVAAIQVLLGEEVLASEALVGGLGIVLLANLYPEQVRARYRHALTAIGAAVVVFAVLAAVPLAVQFLGPQHVVGVVQQRNTYVSDLLGFIIPTPQLQLAPSAVQGLTARFSGYPAEWDAYLGVPLIAMIIVTAVRFRRRPLVRFMSALFVVVAALSLGPTLHVAGVSTIFPIGALALAAPLLRRFIPYPVVLYAFPLLWVGLAAAPIVSSVLPARLMLYGFLLAAFLLAIFADAALRGERRVLSIFLIGASVVVLIPRVPIPSASIETPSFFTSPHLQRIQPGSVALVIPYARRGSSTAMLWQAASGMHFRMPEGYILVPGPSFDAPPTPTSRILASIATGLRPPEVTDAVRAGVLADLAAWKVRAIVVGPMAYRDRAVAFMTAVMGRAPVSDGGVDLWTDVGSE